jgi:hypothetical protein
LLKAATPILPLAIAMIEPAFRALLVACVGASPLLPAGIFAAGGAAIAMSTIAVGADEEYGVTLLAETDSLKENCFAVSLRHASSQAGTRQRPTLRGRLEPPLFGLPDEGYRTGTLPLPTTGFPRFTPHDTIACLVMMGRMTAPAARMMSLFRREVQKSTFSDDR